MLVIRELLDGSTGFNEIARGVPAMSRTLLAERLKEMVTAGLVTRSGHSAGKKVKYQLSQAGQALGPVVRGIAEWGQTWIDVEPSLERIDVDFLMWDIRRNVRRIAELPDRFVVEFRFPDAPEEKSGIGWSSPRRVLTFATSILALRSTFRSKPTCRL